MQSIRVKAWLFFGVIGVANGVPGCVSAADDVGTRIRKAATAPNLGAMRVGIRIETLGPDHKVIYEQNSDQAFKPASNQKLLTTAAAMTMLSADFKYRTLLAQRGGDLVIIGAGDPSIGDPRMAKAANEPITAIFHQWAEQLKAKGITRVRGNFLFDDFIFDQEYLRSTWRTQFKNLQSWYIAPVGGLNFNDNCVDVLVKPASEMGQPALVSLIPATPYLRLDNRTKTAAKGQPNIARSSADPRTISVSGTVSRGNSADDAQSIAIVDPGEFFASACRTALAAQGIEIAGETRRERVRTANGTLPPEVKTVAVYERKLSDILWRVDKSSLNVFAEGILKTVGAYAGRENAPGVGSYDSGRAVEQKFLTKIGVPPGNYVIDDGSGLSHDNRVTPMMLTTILRYMDTHPRHEEWWSNLAVPGEKIGTLKKRMKSLEGHVFAKTGTIESVSALSGYVKGPNNRRYAFSILCNDTQKSKGGGAHPLQDEICRILATGE